MGARTWPYRNGVHNSIQVQSQKHTIRCTESAHMMYTFEIAFLHHKYRNPKVYRPIMTA